VVFIDAIVFMLPTGRKLIECPPANYFPQQSGKNIQLPDFREPPTKITHF